MAKKKSPAAKDKTRISVFVGTDKGGFIFTSDRSRKEWKMSGPHFKGASVMHINLDPRDRRLHAATAHFVYGHSTHYSDDFGKTWAQAKVNAALLKPSTSGRPLGSPEDFTHAEQIAKEPEQVIKTWNIQPGRASEPNVLYAGVQPAALFKSTDRGETWELNEALYNHPHRGQFNPGAGGLCLHTIILDPNDVNRMYVAISAGGFYRSDDGGQTWQARNKNLLADFSPVKYPEFGQCVHKVDMHPARPNVLYQQNHCGVYRSDDFGDNWIDTGLDRLPSRFGFPVVVHPHDPKTVYHVLEDSQEYRLSVDGKFSVWRSKNSGDSWKRLSNGLPQNAYLTILREAMAADTLDDAGLYVGSNTGQLFYSRDEGDSWEVLADFLPPIQSVETAVIN